MRAQAVQCILIANKLSARQTLFAREFSLGPLAVYDCSKGSLVLIARETLIRYAETSGFTGQWSGV